MKYLTRGNLALLFLLLVPLIFRFTPLGRVLASPGDLRSFAIEHGLTHPHAFVDLGVLVLLIGTPRFVVAVLGGFLFGFFPGLLLSLIPVLLVAGIFYAMARKRGLRETPAKLPGFLRDHVENPTFMTVFLIRQLPMPAPVLNVALAKLHPPVGMFFLGTLVGVLPQAVVAAAVGAGIATGGGKHRTLEIVLAVLCGVTALGVHVWAHQRAMRRRQAASATPEA